MKKKTETNLCSCITFRNALRNNIHRLTFNISIKTIMECENDGKCLQIISDKIPRYLIYIL